MNGYETARLPELARALHDDVALRLFDPDASPPAVPTRTVRREAVRPSVRTRSTAVEGAARGCTGWAGLPISVRRRAAVLCALVSLATAIAQRAPAPAATPPDAWRVVADREHGFALRLPASHDLARHGTQWYVHGWLEDEPLVPDMSVAFLPGVGVQEVVAREFPPSAEASPVSLGPATRGLRVTATYEARDGTPYRATSYLVEGDDGSYRIDRYEDFDWAPFEAVARSFHFVTFADESRPGR